MAKSADAFRTISEVAEWLDVPAHVLRFWESKFNQIKPVKRAGGRRYYRPSDMSLIGGIKVLLHDDGMTIKGVQKVLREQGVRHVSSLSPAIDPETDDSRSAASRAVQRHAERGQVLRFQPPVDAEPVDRVQAETPEAPLDVPDEASAHAEAAEPVPVDAVPESGAPPEAEAPEPDVPAAHSDVAPTQTPTFTRAAPPEPSSAPAEAASESRHAETAAEPGDSDASPSEPEDGSDARPLVAPTGLPAETESDAAPASAGPISSDADADNAREEDEPDTAAPATRPSEPPVPAPGPEPVGAQPPEDIAEAAAPPPSEPEPLGTDIPADPEDGALTAAAGPLARLARIRRIDPELAARIAPLTERLHRIAAFAEPRA